MKTSFEKILITGATGTLGRELCKGLLSAGNQLVAHCRPTSRRERIESLGLPLKTADLRRPDQLRDLVQGVDAVIHTAALVNFRGDRLTQFTGINTMGAVEMYRAARAAGVKRFLHVSTVAAIGAVLKRKSGLPLTEAAQFNLGHLRIPYILSKQAAEVELVQLAREGGPELVIVNPSIIAVPNRAKDDPSRPLAWLSGRFVPVTSNRLNLVDMRDLVPGIISALENGQNGQRYILAGENIPFDELHAEIRRRIDRRSFPVRLPRPLLMGAAHTIQLTKALFNRSNYRLYPDLVRLLDYDWVYDSTRARSELGFNPRPLRETLDDLLLNQNRSDG